MNILNSDLMYIIEIVVTDLTQIVVLFFCLFCFVCFLNNIDNNNWLYSVFLTNTSSDGSGLERCSVYKPDICDTATIKSLYEYFNRQLVKRRKLSQMERHFTLTIKGCLSHVFH